MEEEGRRNGQATLLTRSRVFPRRRVLYLVNSEVEAAGVEEEAAMI